MSFRRLIILQFNELQMILCFSDDLMYLRQSD